MRSARRTQPTEIKELITASASQVGQGVQLVSETGKALQQIVAEVAEITSAVTDTRRAPTSGASRLHEVNTAVNQIDQVTQQNAAMVEETTAASHALSHETEQLTGLVDRFQLRRGTVEPMRRPSPKSAAPRPAAPKAAPQPTVAWHRRRGEAWLSQRPQGGTRKGGGGLGRF